MKKKKAKKNAIFLALLLSAKIWVPLALPGIVSVDLDHVKISMVHRHKIA